MNIKFKYFLIVVCFLVITTSYAQQQNLLLNREYNLINQKAFNELNSNTHTSFQPIIKSQITTSDSLTWLSNSEKEYYLYYVTKSVTKPKKFLSWLNQSFFHQNFIVVDTGNFYLTIDPVVNLEFGEDIEDKSFNKQRISTNTRGAMIRGNIGQKFSFQTAFYENQSFFPKYLDDYANTNDVIPGQGRFKKFKKTGFDYAYSSAYISYSPSKHFNFQLGNDKHFIGDGYRSLLLSDASTNYPFLKATVLFAKDKLQFTKLHADLTNLERRPKGSVPESLFMRKSMSVHYINWLATKWLNIGLFESTIWQTEDSTGTLPFQFLQLNPVLFVNTLSTGFNTNNHSIFGTNTKIKLPFKTVIYNQFVYDGNVDDSQIGFQAGLTFYAIKNLTLQGEINTVAPSTYTSTDNNYQGYNHYNQPLAHPINNNFNEVIGIINYKYKRYYTQIKVNIADYIYAPTFEDATLTTLQAHLGFLINPKNNLSFLIGTTNRTEKTTSFTSKTNYVYFSIQTSLRNLYTDF